MKNIFIISIIILGLAACEHAESHDHNHSHDMQCEHDHHHEDMVSNTVVFSHEQMGKVDFQLQKLSLQPVCQVIKTVAQVIPAQGEVKIITAATDGIVEFGGNDIVPGYNLTKNMVIFTINNNKMAHGNLSVLQEEIKAEYERAKINFERKQSLYEDRLVSESDLKQAETEYKKAKTAYDNMKENFADGKQLVKSPVNGSVKDVFVENGSYVTAGQGIMTIINGDDVYLKADVQSKYYTQLKNIKTANVKRLNVDEVFSLEDLDGRLLSYGKSVSVENPMIPVTFKIKNKAGFVCGQFVELFIIVNDNNNGIMIPNSSIVEEMGRYFVFVQVKPELFEKRAVTIGVGDGGNIQVIKGLEAGETVVVKGAIYVKLAQGSGKLDPHAGHVH